MARSTTSWRLQKDPRSGGRWYWTLLRGSGRERVSVALGVLDEPEARRCLLHAREDEEQTRGTPRADRLIWLGREDREALIHYLLHPDRDAEATLFGDADPDYGNMTLEDYKEYFWPYRKEAVAETTWRGEERVWRLILRSDLATTRLRRLDEWKWETYVQGMKASGRSGNTRRLHKAAYKALLDFAHRRGHLRGVHAFFKITGSSKRALPAKVPLDAEEVGRLLDASGPMHRCMWALGIGQGLRPSELVRACWEDFDFSKSVMAVRGSKTDGSVAKIPMTPFAYCELYRYWRQEGEPREGPVFLWEGRPIKNFKKALATAAHNAEIDRPVTPGLLRPSFATLAWALGVDKDVARRVLRHTTTKMLDEVYCRPRPEALVERVKAFDLAG